MAAVFVTGCFFTIFFYLGLPFGFSADYVEFINTSAQFNFKQLILMTLEPYTPGWFFMDGLGMAHLRPVQYLIFKFYYVVFGAGPLPYQIGEAVACGFLCALMFALILKITRSALYGWLGILLYLSFPTNFFAINLFLTPVYFLSLLTLLIFVIFGNLTFHGGRSWRGFILGALALYFLVLMAIKLKSAEKTIPPILITFLLLRSGQILRAIGKGKYALLFGVSIVMMLLVVPVSYFGPGKSLSSDGAETPIGEEKIRLEGSARKESMIRKFNLTNVYGRVVQDEEGEFPFTTLFRKTAPKSLSEAFGFFMNWIFWLLLPLMLFVVPWSDKTARGNKSLESAHYFWLLLLWSGFIVMGFGGKFASTHLAYLNYLFLPAVPFFFIMLSFFERRFLKYEVV